MASHARTISYRSLSSVTPEGSSDSNETTGSVDEALSSESLSVFSGSTKFKSTVRDKLKVEDIMQNKEISEQVTESWSMNKVMQVHVGVGVYILDPSGASPTRGQFL